MIRTFEAEIAEKIRTSSLGEKLGVLIKKKVYTVYSFFLVFLDVDVTPKATRLRRPRLYAWDPDR